MTGGNSDFAYLLKPHIISSCSFHSAMKTTPRLGYSHWSPASSIPGIGDSLYAVISKVAFIRQKKGDTPKLLLDKSIKGAVTVAGEVKTSKGSLPSL